MTQSATPWFYHHALSQRFAEDVRAALSAARISPGQQQWLQRLIDNPHSDQPLPRVDHLLTDTQLPMGAELAGAWVISDPSLVAAPLLLSTLLRGIESFADRDALNAELILRLPVGTGMSVVLEGERVEGKFFEQRMLAIVDQQAGQLQALSQQLDELPSLHTAIGKHLQEAVDRQLPGAGIEVFSHLLQVVSADGTQVFGTMSLADAAYQDQGTQTANPDKDTRRRFMSASGELLSETQAQPWVTTLAEAGNGLAGHFERLLDQYWLSRRDEGVTVREFAARGLAEAFSHEILKSVHEQRLTETELRYLVRILEHPALPLDEGLCRAWQLSLELEGQGSPKLAGVFAMEFAHQQMPGLYLFSAAYGLRRFASRQGLEQHFSSAQTLPELIRCTSLNEHAGLQAHKVQRVRLDLIEQPLFVRMLDSIIALQKRNLQHVLGLASVHHQRAAVRVDDALDIRHLLDRRLLGLHDAWRWTVEQDSFEQRWAARQTVAEFGAAQLDAPMYSLSGSWYGQLSSLDGFVDRQCQLYEHVVGCMRLSLNRYLSVFGEQHMDARDLWVHSAGSANIHLISLALARFSGHPGGPLAAGSKVLPEAVSGRLPVDLLEAILNRVTDDFVRRYDWHLRSFFLRPVRWLDTQLRPRLLNGLIRDCALRLQVSMERRRQELDVQSLDMFQQVLDRPTAALRQALGTDQVDAHRVQLIFDPAQPALALGSVLVLSSTAAPGRYVLWSLSDGLSSHASLQALEQNLARRFDWPAARQAWMALLNETDRQRLQGHLDNLQHPLHLKVSLQRLDGHVFHALQQTEIERHCQKVVRACQQALPRKLSADLLRHVLRESEDDDGNRPLLDHLGLTMELMLTDALLPAWMKEASIAQLFSLSALIKNWYIACNSGKDFLVDIPEPGHYARDRLLARLQADFPGAEVDPDRIMVTLTRYISAPVAIGQIPQAIPAASSRVQTSLSEYAIGRFGASQDGILSVSTGEAAWPGKPISAEYLSALIRELDIAAGYRTLLRQTLSHDSPDYAMRLRYYALQVPALELLRTYAMRVRGELSDEAFCFVEGVMIMPDGLGRLQVLGRDIIISPLQLRAAPGLAADTVLGAFIIAPLAPQPGPWLLYTLFNADFVVEEYASEAALLSDIHTDQNLQKFILSRLPAPARRLYDNGGFVEPHLPFSTESDLDVPWETPAPVGLVLSPVQGNALQALFDSTGQVLRWWFEQLSVTNAEDQRMASRFLWGLGAEQALALLPGRLGALVGLWQSHDLLHASAMDVVQMQWGKAAAELLAAVGVLITVRRSRQEELLEPERLAVDRQAPRLPDLSQFGWGKNSLTPDLWSRLRLFQANDVALATLTHDPLFNTYKDTAGRTYATIAGAVYRIDKDEYGWFIVGDNVQGPRVVLRQQQWELNLQLGLRGGGGILTRVKTGLINAEVDDVLIVEARGMTEIRHKYRTRADDIALAHAQAREYLENSLDNLLQRMPDGQPHPRVNAVLKDFFDINVPDERLHSAVSTIVKQLYSVLMDGSLSPYNSARYVVGVRRSSMDDSTAFTFPNEPQKHIYLTDRFFRDPVCRLKPHVLSRSRFNAGIHSRAIVLLHELSHLYSATEDIAYLDAHMPFIDMLEDHSAYRASLKSDLIVRQRGLSYRTPRHELFRDRDDTTDIWYEVSEKNAVSKILRSANTRTMEKARDAFYADARVRSDIMLGNADSVALLVSLLGREKLVP